jgi:hypothetical protein
MFIDEMNYDTCWDLWNAIQSNPIRTARKMFPNKPPMYVMITKKIGQYMANKGTALGITGDLAKERREMYINIAASIWADIPTWALNFNVDFLKEN